MAKRIRVPLLKNAARDKAINDALGMYILFPLHTQAPLAYDRPINAESCTN